MEVRQRNGVRRCVDLECGIDCCWDCNSLLTGKDGIETLDREGKSSDLGSLEDWLHKPVELLMHCLAHPNKHYARKFFNNCRNLEKKEPVNWLILDEVDFSGKDISGFDLRAASLNRTQLYGANLSNSRLEQVSLVGASTERANFRGANLTESYLHGVSFLVCDLSFVKLVSIPDATGSSFHGCKLVSANLSDSCFAGAYFYQCDFADASLQGANLHGATFNECNFSNTAFCGARIDQMTIINCSLENSDFRGASGEMVTFSGISIFDGIRMEDCHMPAMVVQNCKLKNLAANNIYAQDAMFRNVRLSGVDFSLGTLKHSHWVNVHGIECRFDGSDISHACWREVSMQKLDASNLLAESWHLENCTASGANMPALQGRAVVMRDCNFSDSNITGAYLYRAMLTGDVPGRMSFRNVELSNAVLTQSYLAGNFEGANMAHANLSYARLNQTNLSNAILENANIFMASMVKTNVTDAKLGGVKPPFFADRVVGLNDALSKIPNLEERKKLLSFAAELETLLNHESRRST